jgi:hypothetical protein
MRSLWFRLAIAACITVMSLITYIWAKECERLDRMGNTQALLSADQIDLKVRVKASEVQLEGCSQKLDKMDGKIDKLLDMHLQK